MKTLLEARINDDVDVVLTQLEDSDKFLTSPDKILLDILGWDEGVRLHTIDDIERLYDFLGRALYEIR